MGKATVIKGFLYQEKALEVGQTFEGTEIEINRYRSLGFLEFMERKAPKEKPVKKGKSSAASQADRPSKKKTSKKLIKRLMKS